MSMKQDIYRKILLAELIPAMGCTEPISLALAAARARETLGVPLAQIDRVVVYCSGNIVKNVKGVVVPNSGGARGIEIAVAMGIAGGASERGLEVLASLSQEALADAQSLCAAGKIKLKVVFGEENLYIRVEIYSGSQESSVEIQHDHTRISQIRKNGAIILDQPMATIPQNESDKAELNLKDILEFARDIELTGDEELLSAIRRQIRYNTAIAQEGLHGHYGAQIGRTILEMGDKSDIRTWIKACAAAGSDARMGGSPFPVVINSGSGNQGLTASIPVIEMAADLIASEEQLIRALLISNLLVIHQKRFIGKLSAFCGVVSAAAAAGAGIAYLKGFSYEQTAMVVTNTIATIGGMVCDGAKSSCALKIAQSIDTMLTSLEMAEAGRVFQPSEGLVGNDVEETIRNIGRMAKLGMKATDEEILKIMTE